MASTIARFSDLKEPDVITTLRHLHMRIYHRPMVEGGDDAPRTELADVGFSMDFEGINGMLN